MERTKKFANAKKGFTLIEIIVVLVIIAILAAIAIPSLTGYINQAKNKQVLTEARAVYVAAQAVASQKYKDGDVAASDITATAINDLIGEDLAKDTTAGNDGYFTISVSKDGTITDLTYTDNGKTAHYNGTTLDMQ